MQWVGSPVVGGSLSRDSRGSSLSPSASLRPAEATKSPPPLHSLPSLSAFPPFLPQCPRINKEVLSLFLLRLCTQPSYLPCCSALVTPTRDINRTPALVSGLPPRPASFSSHHALYSGPGDLTGFLSPLSLGPLPTPLPYLSIRISCFLPNPPSPHTDIH